VLQSSKTGHSFLPEKHVKAVHTTASSALIKHGFVNRSSYWYFTWSSSLFCSWTTSLKPVTTRAASMQYNFVLQVKPQDTLLPPPHGQLAPCLVAPPIAFYDEVCARWINLQLNWYQIGLDTIMLTRKRAPLRFAATLQLPLRRFALSEHISFAVL